MEVDVSPSGRLSLAGTPFLAGAGHDLLYDCNYLYRKAGYQLGKILQMAAINPPRLLREPVPALNPWREEKPTEHNFFLAHADRNTGNLIVDMTIMGDKIFR